MLTYPNDLCFLTTIALDDRPLMTRDCSLPNLGRVRVGFRHLAIYSLKHTHMRLHVNGDTFVIHGTKPETKANIIVHHQREIA